MVASLPEVPASDLPDPVLDATTVPAPAPDLDRLEQLARVTAELAAAETLDQVIDIVVSHVHRVLDAAIVGFMLRDGEELRFVAYEGLAASVAQQWASFAVAANTPASEAVRTGRTVVIHEGEDSEARYPLLRGYLHPGRSLVCLPMIVAGDAVGAISLSFDGWQPGQRELEFLATFANTTAQVIQRIRAAETAALRAAQLALLADASAELASSLDYHATLTKVAQLAVPRLADWCTVDIVEGGALRTLAVAHADPAKVNWAWQLQRRWPLDPEATTGSASVVRSGRSELYPEITDEMLVATARDEEHLRVARELGLSSALTVPLTARGRTLGALSMIRAGSGPAYGPDDLAVAEDLGRRAGMAIDNAVLYRSSRDVALQLQRAVLPEVPPSLRSCAVAAIYRASARAEVGGDFYDVLDLGDGRLAVVIGDVMGHGVQAAAAMAHMRAAVRAYASLDPDPASVVTDLDRMFAALCIRQLVTLLYVLLDPGSGEVSLVNAGHPPPLVLGQDGSTRFVSAPPQRPLGVGGERRDPMHDRLDRGATMLLYTDGLVERRDEDIDEGLRRLQDAAGILQVRDLRAATNRLVGRLHNEEIGDDVTAVALRLPG
jgi:GAF domain-containing protein